MTGYFSVRNFEKFQHYKDRNPPWIRLYNSLLDSYEYACLPDASKAHLVAIYLLASRSNNKIPSDLGWLKSALHASEDVDLDILIKYEFIVPDQECITLLASRKQSAPQSISEDSKNSVAIATDVPSDPTKVFFDTGIALLDELNPKISERSARALLGKLRQKFPDINEAQDALDAMADERPTDPAAWLMACGRNSLPPVRYLDGEEPLDPDFYGVADSLGCDPGDEWESFRDHHAAKGTGFRSMAAAARTWCKRSIEFRQRKLYAVK